MTTRNISLYYFSGTGNTLLAVKRLKQGFESKEHKLRLYAIEKESPTNIDLNSTVGIAFPIAMCTTYPLVMDFIKKMPDANGTKVFILSTMSAFACSISSVIKEILDKKGYRTLSSKQLIMPDNFSPKPENKTKNQTLIESSYKNIDNYVKELLEQKKSWAAIPFFPRFFYSLSQSLFKLSFVKKGMKLDSELCTNCGLCEKLCPVKNITIHDKPAFGSNCQLCVRCMSFCPDNAIYKNKKRPYVYKAIKVEELL